MDISKNHYDIEMLAKGLTPKRLERMRQVLAHRTRYLSIVLEDIYQPHNASAVLRTCDAYGVQDIHVIQKNNVFTPNPEISLGSAKWLDVHKYANTPTEQVYSTLRQQNYKIVAAALREDATTPDMLDVSSGPIALIFGSELNGLTEQALTQADETICIPMLGFVKSFNISVSVAIILSQLMPKIRALGDAWHLSNREADEILLEWLHSDVLHAPKGAG
ncbi:RNA methyltransferase [Candidatus Haliotispira prima]|uniref:tRNA (guanosine(18)-2'-O)-methyltransferase n=1 Tax=Candidatus Haliotispira prima TaxID=3034016 RepID=A0ABY8MHB9_9SPIO|nr:RNA methyltransferase [Candidatus Haliotispira prima]